jgi:hypothetical protein
MKKLQWNIQLEGVNHTVEMTNGFKGKQIFVNGENINYQPTKKQFTVFAGVQDEFEYQGHKIMIVTEPSFGKARQEIAVDGISVETGQPIVLPLPVPKWGWIFVFACFCIICLGGALPAMIGFIGAMACAKISRMGRKGTAFKVLCCLGVTIVCWVAMLIVAVGVAAIRG